MLFDYIFFKVLDSGLIGENFLPTLRDAKKRLCKNNNVTIIPAKAKVFATLIHSPDIALHQNNYLSSSTSTWDPSGNPMCINLNFLKKNELCWEISEPFEIFEFDFENLPPEEGRRMKYRHVCYHGGGESLKQLYLYL